MSVAENIFLNRLPRRGGFLRFANLHAEVRQALTRVGLGALDPATPAGFLGVGQQQLVEIAGALSQNCRLLILDEPTAALTDPEIEQLFGNIRQLQNEGVGIIYVSHRMDEIRRIADRITVMRDGRCVATHKATGVTPTKLIREMVGHDLPARKTASGKSRNGQPSSFGPGKNGREAEMAANQCGTNAKAALRVCNLRAGDRVREVTFEVQHGEILGLAGLIGAGGTGLYAPSSEPTLKMAAKFLSMEARWPSAARPTRFGPASVSCLKTGNRMVYCCRSRSG